MASHDSKSVDFNAPKTTLYKAIRKKICASKPDDVTIDGKGRPKGLGDDAISKVVTPLFEADQKKAQREQSEESSKPPSKL